MTKNIYLNTVIVFCKLLRLFLIIGFLGFTFLFIIHQIDKDFIESKNLKWSPNKSQTFSKTKRWHSNSVKNVDDIYKISKLKIGSLYLNYIQYTLILLCFFIAVREFEKILISVRRLDTFDFKNVKSFRKIGTIILLYMIFTSYSSFSFEDGGISQFNFSFTPLILAFLSFIMAEVFKEGFSLKQENDLTI